MSVKNMDDQKKKVALVALDYINYKLFLVRNNRF